MNEMVTQQTPPSIGINSRGVQLTTLEDSYRFAKAVVASGLAPKGYTKPEAVMIAIQHGAELGLSPMQSLASIAVVNGRACLWGDGLKALVEASPLCEGIVETIDGAGEAMVATCRAQRVGRDEPCVRSFSVADAKKASLWGKAGPWASYPARMLQMRARSWCLRDQFADVLCGLAVAEEVLDAPTDRLVSGTVAPVQDLDALVEVIDAAPVLEAPDDPFGPEPVKPADRQVASDGAPSIDELLASGEYEPVAVGDDDIPW